MTEFNAVKNARKDAEASLSTLRETVASRAGSRLGDVEDKNPPPHTIPSRLLSELAEQKDEMRALQAQVLSLREELTKKDVLLREAREAIILWERFENMPMDRGGTKGPWGQARLSFQSAAKKVLETIKREKVPTIFVSKAIYEAYEKEYGPVPAYIQLDKDNDRPLPEVQSQNPLKGF